MAILKAFHYGFVARSGRCRIRVVVIECECEGAGAFAAIAASVGRWGFNFRANLIAIITCGRCRCYVGIGRTILDYGVIGDLRRLQQFRRR